MASKIKNVRPRSYLNRDFDSFRAELVEYARTYFSDKITDFSENGMGGLFVEMASYVGDTMSYYLDHQFNELDIQTAVEPGNIERLVRMSGVKIQGAAPATATVDFYIEVDSILKNTSYIPDVTKMPVVKMGTLISSKNGVMFELLEDLNYTKTDSEGNVIAEYETRSTDSSGNPLTFSVKLTGVCQSGITSSQSFVIPDSLHPFRTITLSSPNVVEIIHVSDSNGNTYYQVDALTQDVVYKRVVNIDEDNDLVPENIELLPAPYRFISTTSRQTGMTSLRFGGGSADTFDNDIIPDPSEVALPLYGSKMTFSRFTIDPNALLETRTLGISPRNTTITVRYRAGGGLSHNVSANQIQTVSTLLTEFSSTTSASVVTSVRSSMEVDNPNPASGGEAAMTLNELRATALAFRNSQSRIVTKSDLIARIYTMPSNFGRVFRIGIRSNPNNPLATELSILSRSSDGRLIISPDSLKENLRLYVNEFRLISDAIDIIDAQVFNMKIEYGVVVDTVSNKNLTIQSINSSIKEYMSIENFQIDQPIMTSDLINLIINASGVISLVDFSVSNMVGEIDGREYSTSSFSVASSTDRGMIYAPSGGIFEVKYPDDDIVGSAR